jgi:hypothetical protein
VLRESLRRLYASSTIETLDKIYEEEQNNFPKLQKFLKIAKDDWFSTLNLESIPNTALEDKEKEIRRIWLPMFLTFVGCFYLFFVIDKVWCPGIGGMLIGKDFDWIGCCTQAIGGFVLYWRAYSARGTWLLTINSLIMFALLSFEALGSIGIFFYPELASVQGFAEILQSFASFAIWIKFTVAGYYVLVFYMAFYHWKLRCVNLELKRRKKVYQIKNLVCAMS